MENHNRTIDSNLESAKVGMVAATVTLLIPIIPLFSSTAPHHPNMDSLPPFCAPTPACRTYYVCAGWQGAVVDSIPFPSRAPGCRPSIPACGFITCRLDASCLRAPQLSYQAHCDPAVPALQCPLETKAVLLCVATAEGGGTSCQGN